jgi:hypothetical protein
MFHALAPLTSIRAEINLKAALDNSTVVQCYLASERAYRCEMKLTKSRMLAHKGATDAFLAEMPSLSGLENIANYIACVAFAIATGILVNEEGSALLINAQNALHGMALLLKRSGLNEKIAKPQKQGHSIIGTYRSDTRIQRTYASK